MKIYRLVSYHLEFAQYPILFPIIINYITQHPYWQKNIFRSVSCIHTNKTVSIFYLSYRIYIFITISNSKHSLQLILVQQRYVKHNPIIYLVCAKIQSIVFKFHLKMLILDFTPGIVKPCALYLGET